MTDEMIELSRRAVACPKWRWMPGMKLTAGLRLSESLVPFTFSVDLPDLTDPATVGCLLALVRKAWDDECACALPIDYGPGGVMWLVQLTVDSWRQKPNGETLAHGSRSPRRRARSRYRCPVTRQRPMPTALHTSC